ncbi:four helix bundle protein [Nostoc flagelliforme]|uniref:four helix bundle protein n=1 Tax=Nostoc flagelliforme TaxID=1306274 RepID=UPI001F55A893|nr:four helix bundle protein [Nostoc flagelliforme]
MEQQEQTHRKALNIHLKKDGELNLSGLTLENLSSEEFLIVQQLIDESRARSHSNRQIEELMQRGMMAQTAIAAITVLMFKGRADKARFMNTAQGSLEECRYYLILARDLNYGDMANAINQLEEVSKLLTSYVNSLLTSDS